MVLQTKAVLAESRAAHVSRSALTRRMQAGSQQQHAVLAFALWDSI